MIQTVIVDVIIIVIVIEMKEKAADAAPGLQQQASTVHGRASLMREDAVVSAAAATRGRLGTPSASRTRTSGDVGGVSAATSPAKYHRPGAQRAVPERSRACDLYLQSFHFVVGVAACRVAAKVSIISVRVLFICFSIAFPLVVSRNSGRIVIIVRGGGRAESCSPSQQLGGGCVHGWRILREIGGCLLLGAYRKVAMQNRIVTSLMTSKL